MSPIALTVLIVIGVAAVVLIDRSVKKISTAIEHGGVGSLDLNPFDNNKSNSTTDVGSLAEQFDNILAKIAEVGTEEDVANFEKFSSFLFRKPAASKANTKTK